MTRTASPPAPLPDLLRNEGDLFELAQAPTDPRLSNRDLAPTRIADRTWSTYHVASLWIGMAVCVPTYMLAAGLIQAGMSWWQAMLTILLGNLLVLLPIVAIAHAGTRYGIPFPVLARASFGVVGAQVPSVLRGLVACGWFGIQTWIGGQAIHSLAKTAWPGWERVPAAPWIAFFAFWLANLYIVVRGSGAIKRLEAWAAPFLIVAGLALLGWAAARAGGLGPSLARPSRFATAGEFWRAFAPSLTAMVGFWATLALNIPDLSRFARSQRAQAWGQLLGLPTTMVLFSFIGVAVTSASVVIFGEAIWDPVVLLAKLESPAVIVVALFALAIATLTTNVAANVVAPANALANLWPRRISFAVGGAITAAIGIAIQSPGGCSPTTAPTSSAGWSATRPCSAPSPASSSPTTGGCAGGGCRCPTSTSTTASTAGGTPGRSPPSGPGSASPCWASPSLPCAGSTTTRGSWGSGWGSGSTPRRCVARARDRTMAAISSGRFS